MSRQPHRTKPQTATRVQPDEPVFVISVAAELVGVHPQTLRGYERAGLVTPQRTPGGSRRYSYNNILRLERIQDLVDEGLNLTGVARVLELERRLAEASRPSTALVLYRHTRQRQPGVRHRAPTTAAAMTDESSEEN